MEVVDKPTYEELEKELDILIEQRNNLANQLNQLANINNNLHWAFKVLEFGSYFNQTFVSKIASDIEEILTPRKKNETNTETNS